MVDALEFPVEEIPSCDSVFMRAHKTYFRDGEFSPGVFKAQEGTGMSSDWERYSTAEETRQRAKKPSENAVLVLKVGAIREIPKLNVVHIPESANRAHCETSLPDERVDLIEVRLLLKRLANIVIPLPS